MTLFRCSVTIPMTSGLNEDAATNTFYFDAISSGELEEIDLEVSQFYNVFIQDMSSSIDPLLFLYSWYDMSEPEPRLPIREQVRVQNVPSGDSLPHEVALCLSYEGSRVSGIPQRSRRGRIYVGPLGENANDNLGRPTLEFIGRMQTAASTLRQSGISSSSWSWVIYSPTLGTWADIQGGWVDNEFDTQRRRGRQATLRANWN